jgi:hypothetical protein
LKGLNYVDPVFGFISFDIDNFVHNCVFPERRKTILAKNPEIEHPDIDLTELEFVGSLET